jgi:hypothetical protein
MGLHPQVKMGLDARDRNTCGSHFHEDFQQASGETVTKELTDEAVFRARRLLIVAAHRAA